MERVVTLVTPSMLMVGYASSGKVSIDREWLQHHRFVLQSVNGKTVTTASNPSELSFGENMTVSGEMYNQFHGQGKLSDGELKVKDMAMTRIMRVGPQLNAPDGIVSEMFKQGIQIDLTADQSALAAAE